MQTITSFFIPYVPHILLAILSLVIILIVNQIALYIKLRTFLKGSDATSLEPRIIETLEEVTRLKKHDEMLATRVIDIDTRLSTSIRTISMVRFKAFESNASNQSFSLALLDEQGNGIVFTSLHLRDRINTYAKQVINYESTHDLTDEEKQVIHQTKEGQKK